MRRWVSEIVGTGEGADKSSVTVYRALRQLICAPCGGAINEGALFTRRSLGGGGLRILPQCRKCVPFNFSAEGEPKRPRSKMLEALLAPQPEREADPPSKEGGDRDALDEAVAKRLGPALRRTRNR
jgi:hypothetical protein